MYYIYQMVLKVISEFLSEKSFRSSCTLHRHLLEILAARILASKIHEEFDQVRFLYADCLANLEGSVGVILYYFREPLVAIFVFLIKV